MGCDWPSFTTSFALSGMGGGERNNEYEGEGEIDEISEVSYLTSFKKPAALIDLPSPAPGAQTPENLDRVAWPGLAWAVPQLHIITFPSDPSTGERLTPPTVTPIAPLLPSPGPRRPCSSSPRYIRSPAPLKLPPHSISFHFIQFALWISKIKYIK